MDIVSPLFCQTFDMHPVPSPASRITLSGLTFSTPAPGGPPVTIPPHRVVLFRCRSDERGRGVLEVAFTDETGKEVARNASPFTVEPGKFTYRLVRGALTYETLGTVEAHCRADQGQTIVVPLPPLPPVQS